MKNLPISKKLFLGFGAMILMIAITAGASGLIIHSISAQANLASTETVAWIILAACIIVSIVVAVVLAGAIRQAILMPVREIERVYTEISKGNMQEELDYESEDELGNLAHLIRQTNKMHTEIVADMTDKLTRISQGDMQVKVECEYPGDFHQIKEAIQNTIASINYTMMTIGTAAEQVSTGAEHVSSGAQALAAGSTQQASAIEQLNTSITKVADQATDNSINVQVATQYVEEASEGVEAGNEHMSRLTEAMANIDESSRQIANITKVIEDIAFQTNILALNAAIEAARAGNAGKGFAVVADEVRNLAAKSAEAAKQTGELIERSTGTVSEGTEISQRTAEILREVLEKARQASDSIVKIEEASSDQAIAIEEIRHGLSQVASVVQTNAATAEENSATSEEMSAQAIALQHEVNRFKVGNVRDGVSSAFAESFDEMTQPSVVAFENTADVAKY